jgi:hypothetical protein
MTAHGISLLLPHCCPFSIWHFGPLSIIICNNFAIFLLSFLYARSWWNFLSFRNMFFSYISSGLVHVLKGIVWSWSCLVRSCFKHNLLMIFQHEYKIIWQFCDWTGGGGWGHKSIDILQQIDSETKLDNKESCLAAVTKAHFWWDLYWFWLHSILWVNYFFLHTRMVKW